MRSPVRKTLAAIAVVAVAALPLTACSAGDGPRHKVEHSQVYSAGDGFYTPTFDGTSMVWWILANAQAQPAFNPAGASNLGGGSWSRVSSPPVSPVSTGVVVQTGDRGLPSSNPEEVESLSEAEADGDAVTDETTTDAEAAAEVAEVESYNDSVDADTGGGDSGDSGSSDSGSDSGGSDFGGGDSGGGDAGGGGDF
jgi:uncharacterized membrane protein YgcG